MAEVLPVETNIVMLKLADAAPDAQTCTKQLKELGVQVTPVGIDRLRIVTHMDSTDEGVTALIDAMGQLQVMSGNGQ